MSDNIIIPEIGQKVFSKSNPSKIAIFTGKTIQVGKQIFVEICYPDGATKKISLSSIEIFDEKYSNDPRQQMYNGIFGKKNDFERLVTFEKLKGTLNEVIYSMEAAKIDFYPYQFKPVLKFINSPSERLILADEVGLGKTIESGLIWLEMQARYKSKRLLVVCPKILAEKWEQELREKFLVDASIVDIKIFQKNINLLKTDGDAHSFAMIATYSMLRPPKSARQILNEEFPKEEITDLKTSIMHDLKFWRDDLPIPFDLVIFDEAHSMRNTDTSTHLLGECISENSKAVLCVSATPINNKSEDLYSLLTFIDDDFFGYQNSFEILMASNRPTVRAASLFALPEPDIQEVEKCIDEMENNQYISNSPLFYLFKEKFANFKTIKNIDDDDIVVELQDILDRLNIFGTYINRTRRVQVKERRAKRDVQIVTVSFTQEEMQFYNSIHEIIANHCREIKNKGNLSKTIEIFTLINYQLMAASCIPAFATRILNKDTSKEDGPLDFFEEDNATINSFKDIYISKELIKYFIKNDSKFYQLDNILHKVGKNRVVIFSFYRMTIKYLQQRLKQLNYSVSIIHGGIKSADRWKAINRFIDGESQILLASEVGCEGIDLQCAHIMINYDLPWNPMRVEQRIGRIDRVGQVAEKLTIYNFNILNTIEQRIYSRLHEKLQIFSDSLGDLEEIIGKEINKLTVDLITDRLSPEEEEKRIMETHKAIANNLYNMKSLEEQSSGLVGLSDYIQKKIEESHGRGRYIYAEELSKYLTNFFEYNFKGTEINYDTPEQSCLTIRLSDEARESLFKYIQDDRSLMAKDLRKEELNITFDKNILKNIHNSIKNKIVFVNHLSPLFRWITDINTKNDSTKCRTTAVNIKSNKFPRGTYVFCLQRWIMKDIYSFEKLAWCVKHIDTSDVYSLTKSEDFINEVIKEGEDWLYPCIENINIKEETKNIEESIDNKFKYEVENFTINNENTRNIKKKRVEYIYGKKIDSIKKTINSLKANRRSEKIIKITEARLRKNENIKNFELKKLEYGATNPEISSEILAFGVVVNSI